MVKMVVPVNPERAESMNKTVDALNEKEAKAQSGNRANTLPEWKPYKRASEISQEEIDAEVMAKTGGGVMTAARRKKLLKEVRKEKLKSFKSS